ncbi:RING finger domain-containing protein [Thiolapillus sp.]|uniref:RING finger domain-containing protein n=1 Tax=Thiolapillus sp. TaxID=2017437 RepID=UPI003AF5BCCC
MYSVARPKPYNRTTLRSLCQLPCSHLLCRHCLISWLQSKAEANCPLCRCVIVDPEERTGVKSLEDIGTGPHFNVIYFRK